MLSITGDVRGELLERFSLTKRMDLEHSEENSLIICDDFGLPWSVEPRIWGRTNTCVTSRHLKRDMSLKTLYLNGSGAIWNSPFRNSTIKENPGFSSPLIELHKNACKAVQCKSYHTVIFLRWRLVSRLLVLPH